MKIKFIYPKFRKFLEDRQELANLPKMASVWEFRMPPAMGIPILVSLLPEGVNYVVEDQNIDPIIL